MDYIALGKRVKSLRKQKGMTQEQLAEKADISASYLGHIERGTRCASIDTLEKLWEALNTDANSLLCNLEQSIRKHVPAHLDDDVRDKVVEIIRWAMDAVNQMGNE